jgi:hypothetical protein
VIAPRTDFTTSTPPSAVVDDSTTGGSVSWAVSATTRTVVKGRLGYGIALHVGHGRAGLRQHLGFFSGRHQHFVGMGDGVARDAAQPAQFLAQAIRPGGITEQRFFTVVNVGRGHHMTGLQARIEAGGNPETQERGGAVGDGFLGGFARRAPAQAAADDKRPLIGRHVARGGVQDAFLKQHSGDDSQLGHAPCVPLGPQRIYVGAEFCILGGQHVQSDFADGQTQRSVQGGFHRLLRK